MSQSGVRSQPRQRQDSPPADGTHLYSLDHAACLVPVGGQDLAAGGPLGDAEGEVKGVGDRAHDLLGAADRGHHLGQDRERGRGLRVGGWCGLMARAHDVVPSG